MYNVLKKVKPFKATGPDGISDILNRSYTEGTVPIQWKKAIVIPIPKQYPANIEKLRPVSRTDGFAKISEEFVANWVLHDIQHNIDINQYGNVKGVATSHYLVSLMHFLHSGADLSNNMGTVVLTDFSKAFDLIDHTLLINFFFAVRCKRINYSLDLPFYFQQTTVCQIQQSLSDFKTSNGGLPQGTKSTY